MAKKKSDVSLVEILFLAISAFALSYAVVILVMVWENVLPAPL